MRVAISSRVCSALATQSTRTLRKEIRPSSSSEGYMYCTVRTLYQKTDRNPDRVNHFRKLPKFLFLLSSNSAFRQHFACWLNWAIWYSVLYCCQLLSMLCSKSNNSSHLAKIQIHLLQLLILTDCPNKGLNKQNSEPPIVMKPAVSR